MRSAVDSRTEQNPVKMQKIILSLLLLINGFSVFSQGNAFHAFLADSSMKYASVSFCAADAATGKIISEYQPERSLATASIMKLVTSATALETLGPDYSFTTSVGYTGTLSSVSGELHGDIVITGGGDPSLGSPYFNEHYQDFLETWVNKILSAGIKKINGRIVTDDSYYDYQPVPPGWTWEDIGNYYGAGVYGLSVFDNTYEIHLRTGADSSDIEITSITPARCVDDYTSMLIAHGSRDEGYVFSAPYNTYSWYSGSVPVMQNDFILKASITDPPLLIAGLLTDKLKASGVTISGEPETLRMARDSIKGKIYTITTTVSPKLKNIIKVLNHESVNLYAEHLLKELGRHELNKGSTECGIKVIRNFIKSAGIDDMGMFITDGSGLSPSNSLNTESMVKLLVYMKNKGRYYPDYLASLPEAGKEGTLKNYFHEPAFSGRMRAKSGSMTRVRSYAGYLKTFSGKDVAFCIIVNDFTGSSSHIVSEIEKILEELIIIN